MTGSRLPKQRVWSENRLGSVLCVKHGFAFKSANFSEHGGNFVVVTPGNFDEGGGFRPKAGKEKYYTSEPPAEYVLNKDDLLVVMTEQKEGLIGASGLIPEGGKYLHNQRLGLITDLDKDAADKHFLYYLFNFHDVRQQLAATASGMKVRHTSPSRIEDVRIRMPPVGLQRRISTILSAYDDLVENNARRIEILEEMAGALYREWFVEFRFPGHERVGTVDSELGPIPEGWEVTTLSEVCEIVMGQSPRSEFYNDIGDGLPFHQGVSDFGTHFPAARIYCTVDNRLAEAGDILFSVRAPVGRINVTNRRIVIGRGLSAIRSREDLQSFTLYQLKEIFQEEDLLGGGTIFNSVTKRDMQRIKLLRPGRDWMERFEHQAQTILQQIRTLTETNANLKVTRDLLLPRLVSGEVDVSEAAEGSLVSV